MPAYIISILFAILTFAPAFAFFLFFSNLPSYHQLAFLHPSRALIRLCCRSVPLPMPMCLYNTQISFTREPISSSSSPTTAAMPFTQRRCHHFAMACHTHTHSIHGTQQHSTVVLLFLFMGIADSAKQPMMRTMRW
jgi:hypothetical protein